MRTTRRLAGALLLSIVVLAPLSLSTPSNAGAQQAGVCEVAIDGQPIGGTTWRRPFEIDVDEVVVVTGQNATGGDRFVADVTFGEITVHTFEEDVGGGEFSVDVDVSDFANIGVGLYRVEVRQPCAEVVWISITGRSPLTTVAGISATVVALVGAVLAVRALARGAGCRSVTGPVGGLLTGAGLLVLAQQFSLAPLTLAAAAGAAFGLAAVVWAIGCALEKLQGDRVGPPEAEVPVPVPAPPAPVPPHAPQPPPAESGPSAERGAEPPDREAAEDVPRSDQPKDASTGLEELIEEVDFDLDFDLDDEGNSRAVQMFADGPVEVLPTQRFDVEVGIRQLTGEHPELEIYIPTGPTRLEIIAAFDPDEIAIIDDLPATRPLDIAGDDDYPSLTFGLSALSPRPEFPDIEFLFARDGEILGSVHHHLRVAPSADARRYGDERLVNDAAIRPPSRAPADLTVTIKTSTSTPGKLIWLLLSNHDVEIDPAPKVIHVGETPRDFVRTAIARVEAVEGTRRVDDELFGNGTIIANNVPDELWRVLRRLNTRLRRRPRVLLLTEEPHIPWELARIPDDHLPDPSTSPLFAAQAVVGRWPRGDIQAPTPPPERLVVDRIGVVSGAADLPAALAESERLRHRYGAEPVEATADTILAALAASPGYDLVHIALHGVHDPSAVEDGIVTPDGNFVTLGQILGRGVASGAFVFLNACKVGASGEYLGDLSGIAAALIAGGATGVIAPLWAIKDDWAGQVAAHFYEQVFEEGWTPGEVLRGTKAGFTPSADLTSATYAAYVLYGHPNLRLSRRERQEQPESTASP